MASNERRNTETSGWDDLPENIRNDTSIKIFRELWIVREQNRMLLLVTHGFIEMAVTELLKQNSKNTKKILSDSRSFPHSTKLLLLNEIGVLEDSEYAVFDLLRKLRNKAAHEPLFSLRDSDFDRIKWNVDKNPLEDFHNFCIHIVAGILVAHKDALEPIFTPSSFSNASAKNGE